ncbi:uncharacterized protein LOC135479627 [Liolophura sinensis]|uniref:uncharacterized protein LOC135479627 n=1 Tax=Liolophura sinensis TaxID=3198878 RepID=UPI00315890FD
MTEILRILVSAFLIVPTLTEYTFPDYKDHPCVRDCKDNEAPRTCEYNFTIEWYHTITVHCRDCPFNRTDCFRPNCVPAEGTPRAILTVNRHLPGPAIQVCEGDHIQVKVFNHPDMSEGVSLHWHGIHQKGTQYNDGAEMITQCPITPFSSFQYRFVADNPGTHFWHSHAGLQRADGLFGALVVRQSPSKEPHFDKYDNDLPDHVIVVNEWFVNPTINRYAAHVHGGEKVIKDKSLLINGQGVYRKFKETKQAQETFYTPRAVFSVRHGESYRFRVIDNGVSACPITVSVSGHVLSIIASDGNPFEPLEVDAFMMAAGERFDFILTANRDVGNYWLMVQEVPDCGEGERKRLPQQLAIVRYIGASENEPTEPPTNVTTGKWLNSWNAESSDLRQPIVSVNSTDKLEPGFERSPDHTFYLALDTRILDDLLVHSPQTHPVYAFERRGVFYAPQINKITLMNPPSPLLFQHQDVPQDLFCDTESVAVNCSTEYCICVHRLHVAIGDLVELVVVDEGTHLNINHPMHLHGHSFRVLALKQVNISTTMEAVKRLDAEGYIHRNYDNPVQKDTILVPDGGYAVLRFVADNPGFWLFHCHVQFHAQTSMGLVIQVGNDEDMPRRPKNYPKCSSWTFSGYDEDQNKSGQRTCPSNGSSLQPIGIFTLWFYFCIGYEVI